MFFDVVDLDIGVHMKKKIWVILISVLVLVVGVGVSAIVALYRPYSGNKAMVYPMEFRTMVFVYGMLITFVIATIAYMSLLFLIRRKNTNEEV